MATVVILDRHGQLDLEEYRRIAFDYEPVALGSELLAAVDAERVAMLGHLDGGSAAYGINTGLGYLISHAVQTDDQAAFQRSILLGRAAGIGPPLSAPVVRGTMLLRLAGFLSGRAGVSAGLCRFIVDRLNDGWLPAVPAAVSGAAGETVPLAHLFETFVGAGTVLLDGNVVAAADADGGVMVAVRLADVVLPLRNGRLPGGDCRSALVIGGTRRIRTGEPVVFCKIVAVAPAQVRQDGRVQAKGSPVHHATLGPRGAAGGAGRAGRDRRDRGAGGAAGRIREGGAGAAAGQGVHDPGHRADDAGARCRRADAVIALAGDLALVPWARPWVPALERALGDGECARPGAAGGTPGRRAAGLCRSTRTGTGGGDHRQEQAAEDRGGRRDAIGVPDMPANRAMYGSVGTGDDSSPFPQLRGLPMTDASTLGLLGMPHGPAGTGKAAAEQKLLDKAMREFPHLFATDRIWIMDRNYRAPRGALLYRPRSGQGLEEVSWV